MDPMDPYRDDDSRSAGAKILRAGFIALVAVYFATIGVVGWRAFSESPGTAAPEEPLAVSVSVSTVSPAPASRGNKTGIPMVDDALKGFFRGEVEAVFSVLVFQPVGCGTMPSHSEPGLTCREGQIPGSRSELFLTGCEPTWMTAESVRTKIGELVRNVPKLYAVGKEQDGYRAVLSWPDAARQSLVVNISPAGVTSFQSGCALPNEIAIDRPVHW